MTGWELLTLGIITPRSCARGKVIGLSVCCHCQQKKLPNLDFQALLRAVMATKLLEMVKWARFRQESNSSGHESYNRCFCLCHAYQPHPQPTISPYPCAQLRLVGEVARGVCSREP